jgi:hypothetical protein
MPPKQALVSPWPAWYLTHLSRIENQLVFIEIVPRSWRRLAEAGEVLHGHPLPPGFGGMNLALPRTTRETFALLPKGSVRGEMER